MSITFDTLFAALRNKLKTPIAVRELIPHALKPSAFSDKGDLYSLQNRWSELVGPLLDRKSRPVKILGKKLIVEVAGSSWANELEFLKRKLLEKIRDEYPQMALEGLRFQLKAIESFRADRSDS